jgi:hypothetical protein
MPPSIHPVPGITSATRKRKIAIQRKRSFYERVVGQRGDRVRSSGRKNAWVELRIKKHTCNNKTQTYRFDFQTIQGTIGSDFNVTGRNSE